MRKLLLSGGILLLTAGVVLLSGTTRQTSAADTKDAMIGHMVYFTLKDNSADQKAKMVAACKKYLSKHDGEVYFGVGVRDEAFDRPVNDKEWDVGLHLVFKTKADHDKYQDHERHKNFIAENKDNWKNVRVFDSKIEE